jgi:hypothetical protein
MIEQKPAIDWRALYDRRDNNGRQIDRGQVDRRRWVGLQLVLLHLGDLLPQGGGAIYFQLHVVRSCPDKITVSYLP